MNLYFGRDEPRELKSRTVYVATIVLFLFGLIYGKLFYLQIFKGEKFKRLSENNRIRLIMVAPPRGRIFDRDGVLLVGNRPSFNLTVVPEDVRDEAVLTDRMKSLVGIEPWDMDRLLLKNRGRVPFEPVVVKRDLSWDEVAKIETFKLDLVGVGLDIEPLRYYVHGDIFSPLIGHIGKIGEKDITRLRFGDYRLGDLIGKSGIEEMWEESLRGRRGGLEVEIDATGRMMQILHDVKPRRGNDVYLTLDYDLQKVAKEAIGDMVGAVVAIYPSTGEILAMVSNPSYDPNMLAGGLGIDAWKEIVNNPARPLENKAIQGQYPPASTFKIITAAAALEEGIINRGQLLFAGDRFRLGDRIFRDWKEGGHGWIDIYQAIVESSDTFFYQVGLDLGIDTLSRYAMAFGFGNPTGINLKGEKKGLVPTRRWKQKRFGEPWYDGETLSVAVGQGYLLATPLQVLIAYSAIANGGRLLKPILVKKVVNTKGEVIYRSKVDVRGKLPLSSDTIRFLQDALRGVVNDKKGTGRNARIRGVDIAGKTGTAQVVRLKDDDKDEDEIPYRFRDHSWFVGFAPAHDARIAVVVLVEHGGFGASTAAPIAKKVMEAFFRKEKEEKEEGNLLTRVSME